jgi:hypothetical protein
VELLLQRPGKGTRRRNFCPEGTGALSPGF